MAEAPREITISVRKLVIAVLVLATIGIITQEGSIVKPPTIDISTVTSRGPDIPIPAVGFPTDEDEESSEIDDGVTLPRHLPKWDADQFEESLWLQHSERAGQRVPHPPGQIPMEPYIPAKPDSKEHFTYASSASEIAERMANQWRSSRGKPHPSTRPFKFHVYRIPDKYVADAFAKLAQNWPTSTCNRKKSNYTMLDWRHAHSLFTADVLITKYLRFHPSHTNNPDQADVFIIPMMTHVFNCAGTMGYATEVLSWVVQFPYYKRFDNHDHFIFWWRWGMHYNSVLRFWKRVQRYIPRANILSFDYLEIMGRNQWQDFSLALKPKFDSVSDGIVLPYPDFSPALAVPIPTEEVHKERPIFFFFAGTSNIGGIRRWISRNCEAHTKSHPPSVNKSNKICLFSDFATNVVDVARLGVPTDYPSQMKNSVFCGHAAGDALSSRRPTSAVLAGCIPVLICDLCVYAWEQLIDYGSFAVFMKEEDVLNGRMMAILEAIPQEEIRVMQKNLVVVRRRFEYRIDGPPVEGDALDSLVSELSLRGRKLRSYRRWWTANHGLSSEVKDYPVDPPATKLYLQSRAWWTPSKEERVKEERNFNNV